MGHVAFRAIIAILAAPQAYLAIMAGTIGLFQSPLFALGFVAAFFVYAYYIVDTYRLYKKESARFKTKEIMHLRVVEFDQENKVITFEEDV